MAVLVIERFESYARKLLTIKFHIRCIVKMENIMEIVKIVKIVKWRTYRNIIVVFIVKLSLKHSKYVSIWFCLVYFLGSCVQNMKYKISRLRENVAIHRKFFNNKNFC